jgi:crossover junction endodeoxyribonuclease RuvC
MIILGIDPGTITTGYGVIKAEDDEATLVDCGALTASERSPIGERLSYIYQRLLEIIARFNPDVVAIESPFVARRRQSPSWPPPRGKSPPTNTPPPR